MSRVSVQPDERRIPGRRALAVAAGVLLAAVCIVRTLASRLATRRTEAIPFCPVYGRGRVGSDWAHRRELADEPVPGELEDFTSYDRKGFDASAVHPEIRRFYERTADYDLAYETTWHRGFRAGAWLASQVTSRLEQLNLPGRTDGRVRRLESDIAAIPLTIDPRGSRVWTRTDPAEGTAVFVALYATHERDGVTYANVAAPLPWSNLSTVLRPELEGGDVTGEECDGRDGSDCIGHGVRFTTRGASDDGLERNGTETAEPAGDAGLYLVTPLGAISLPMEQTFRVWPANAPNAPSPPIEGWTLVATHEMWIFGRQFLTIRYGIERSGEGEK